MKVKTGPNFSVAGATALFSTARLSMFRAKRYAVAPDARRFLMIQSAEGGPEKLIVVENWFEELKSSRRRALGRIELRTLGSLDFASRSFISQRAGLTICLLNAYLTDKIVVENWFDELEKR